MRDWPSPMIVISERNSWLIGAEAYRLSSARQCSCAPSMSASPTGFGSGGVTVDDIGQQPVQRLIAERMAQRDMHAVIPHHPRNRRQGVQMRRAGLFGRQQTEYQIHRHIVGGI